MSLLAYTLVQQNIRSGANDPQIQMAEDAAAALAKGAPTSSVLTHRLVDIGASLSPYMVIYDENEKPIAGNGRLDSRPPTLPDGVLAFTKAHGEDRITWQPRRDVRAAIVVKYFQGDQSGFVMVGRSLREAEKRTSALLMLTTAVWLAAISFTLIISIILEIIRETLSDE
jgi:hypothetical protein